MSPSHLILFPESLILICGSATYYSIQTCFFCCIPYFENRLCFHFSFLTRHSSFFISHSFLRLLVTLPLLRHPVFLIYTKLEGDILLIPLSLHFPYSSYNFQTQTSNPSNFKPFKPQTPNLFLHFSLISAFISRTPTSKTSCFFNLYQVGG